MTTSPDPAPLEQHVRRFAAAWLRLGDPGAGEELVCDPILVLGPQGPSAVPRAAFLAAVAGRQAAVDAVEATTTLVSTTVVPLGERLVLSTMTWTFDRAGTAVPLVGDFLLLREGDDHLRAVAYLPRTDVRDHLA